MNTRNEKTVQAPIDALIDLVEIATRRQCDMADFFNCRLSAIEDRLALIDAGDNAAGARTSALSSVNLDRVSAGRKVLSFALHGEDAEIRWEQLR